jgi:hypothetical protein
MNCPLTYLCNLFDGIHRSASVTGHQLIIVNPNSVEQSTEMAAPHMLNANIILLSQPDMRDDYPTVRRLPSGRHRPADGVICKLRPGKLVPDQHRAALSILKRRACSVALTLVCNIESLCPQLYHST